LLVYYILYSSEESRNEMGVDCIDVPQDADKWWVVVHRVTKLWVPLNVGISRLAEALISF